MLRKPEKYSDCAASLADPLTSTLSLSICGIDTPQVEDTSGFYVTGDDSKLYFVTARHVVLPNLNNEYERNPADLPRVNVALFGPAALDKYLVRIKDAIRGREVTIEYLERRAEAADDAEEQDEADKLLEEAKRAMAAFTDLQNDVEKDWANIDDRILGHVCFSPPIEYGVGPKKYTQDYALVETDSSKISSARNAIDIGTDMDLGEFVSLVRPNPESAKGFKYPLGQFFKVRGILTEEEMRNPTMLDKNGKPCLFVIKRGSATGLTFGRGNEIFSYVRHYYDNGETQTSKEWAIFCYGADTYSPRFRRFSPFSEKGDSGSGVVDSLGRLGGLLTGGDGLPSGDSSITYATPVCFILDSLKANGFNMTLTS